MSLPQPDLGVLRKAQRGDERAFSIIVRAYQVPVFNYVLRLVGDRALAEDLTQEVFLRVYQGLPRFSLRSKFTTWLFQVTKNRVLDELRAVERRPRAVVDLDDVPSLEVLDAPFERVEAIDAVWRAVENLNVDLKSALLLRDVVGLSYTEIADSLEITLATVKWRIYKAREDVQLALAREGIYFYAASEPDDGRDARPLARVLQEPGREVARLLLRGRRVRHRRDARGDARRRRLRPARAQHGRCDARRRRPRARRRRAAARSGAGRRPGRGEDDRRAGLRQDRGELARDLGGRGPPARIRLEAAANDAGERRRRGAERRRAVGRAGEQLDEHEPERVDVGRRGHLVAARLLGREVRGRAEHRAGDGEPRALRPERDAEVAELQQPVAPEQEVLRLHVAVDETGRVRRCERARRLRAERRRLERRQRAAAGDELGERLAVDVLHRDVRDAVGLADVEDLDDVRMRQPRGDPPLAQEARAQVLVAREILGEALERDVAAELDVAREVDDRHRAVTERALDLVPAGDERRGQRPPHPWPWP